MVDPVFGKLDGYGGYLQKLFASGSAHISGTLTAGDENGFASTFYAGKIHRNAFINSSSPVFTNIISFNNDISNPTGVGNVYLIEDGATITGCYVVADITFTSSSVTNVSVYLIMPGNSNITYENVAAHKANLKNCTLTSDGITTGVTYASDIKGINDAMAKVTVGNVAVYNTTDTSVYPTFA